MKIQTKLFLLLTGFSLVLVLTIVALTHYNIGRGMMEYANKRELELVDPLKLQLAQIYQQNNSWQTLENDPASFYRAVEKHLAQIKLIPLVRRHRNKWPLRVSDVKSLLNSPDHIFDQGIKDIVKSLPQRHRGVLFTKQRYALLDPSEQLIVGKLKSKNKYALVSLEVNETKVGYLAVLQRDRLLKGIELDFLLKQQSYLWSVGIGVMLIVVAFTLPLARHLVSPIKKLAQGIHALTLGDFRPQQYAPRGDEFGQLQKDQIQLARTLARNEEARQQWLANTSHELRTPLGILKGELEAMQDGIRPASSDNIHSVLQEVGHLQKLVEDLHQLNSLATSGIDMTFEKVSLSEFLEEQLGNMQGYLGSQDIHIINEFAANKDLVAIDALRFKQVLENLLQNAMNYAGNGATIKISLTNHLDKLRLTVEDNGPGVEQEKLSQLFDYLYRVEASRNRKTGGSGLGLAICKHIIESHQGNIRASSSALGGLAVHMELPITHD